jgi:hypothetical protein
MNIFFENPNDPPVAPEDVKIRGLTAEPYKDGRRVSVEFEITPFEEKPNLEMVVINAAEEIVATFSVLEAIENKMSFTLHLREANPGGKYTLKMIIFYTDLSALEDEETVIKDMLLDKRQIVERGQVNFSI